MIKLTKREAPPQPIKSEKDYQSGENLAALNEDCYGKCYICEHKASTLNVEHRVPHRGEAALKFDWRNLFLSCGHCNNTKLARYDNILDPSKCDPEDYIAISLTIDALVEKVAVEALSDSESVRQTVELLRAVYNGTTDLKKLESANLRNAVSSCLKKFLQYLEDYRSEPGLGYETLIEQEISRSSEFAAFKRKIVRDDPELAVKFASSFKEPGVAPASAAAGSVFP